MALFDSLFGSPQTVQQHALMTPQQQQLSNQSINQLMSMLGGGAGGKGGFAPVRENAINTFNQQIVPSIAERFSGLDAQRSSAFGQQVGQAGAGLASNLAAQEAGYNQNLMSLLAQLATQPQFAAQVNAAQPGFFQAILPALLQFGGSFFGGPIGGAAGAAAGSGLNSLFSGQIVNPNFTSNVQNQSLANLLQSSPYGSSRGI